MSKCAKRRACLTKRRRNRAAVTEPANGPSETLFMSATRAVEVRLVAAPERHAPHRIADAVPAASDCDGELVVVGVERRQLRAQRHAGRARQRGEARDGVGAAPRRPAPARPPAPAALGVGVADLHGLAARLVSTSPGRKALPAMLFSAAGISTRRRTSSFSP